MKRIILAAFLSAQFSIASAAIGIFWDFEALRDSEQSVLPANTLYAFIADSNNDGILPDAESLLDKTIAVGNEIEGNRIFLTGSTGAGGTAFGNANFQIQDDLGFLSTGDQANARWALYWFPGLTDSAPTLQAGASFGMFQSDNVDTASGGFSAMRFPSQGSQVDVFYFDTETLTGFGDTPTANTPSVSDFSANFTVIPEPSSVGLALLGVLGLMARRRR